MATSTSLQSLPRSTPPPRLAKVLRFVKEAPIAWRGSAEAERVVAIVGSRKPSTESLHFTRAIAIACAEAGVVVASGGAIGIDICAHRSALDAGGRTWAVLATSPERFFPAEHNEFFRALPDRGGTLVWTAAAGAPTPRCFRRRNRVLVALADLVVVVQAAKRSGSVNAGGHALALHTPLLAVPGCPWDDRFAGSVALLAAGAKVADGPERVLAALGATRPRQASLPLGGSMLAGPTSEAHSGTTVEARVRVPTGIPSTLLSAISQVPLSVEEIAARARLDLTITLCALLTLSLENVVVEDLGGRFRLA